MRRNFALTPVTVRASPAVLVLESMFWYSASTSAMAPWSERFTAVGAVPKTVCQRTTRPESGKPAGKLSANCVLACERESFRTCCSAVAQALRPEASSLDDEAPAPKQKPLTPKGVSYSDGGRARPARGGRCAGTLVVSE